MASGKHESLWKIITDYKLCSDSDSKNKNLNCVICKNLMIDAVANNACGCQYCYKCIMEYMSEENKFCPGGKEDCGDHIIIFGSNIVKSELLNKKISKLKVKCPNQSCEHLIELLEMENHLRLCKKKPMQCPYITIGCNIGLINEEIVKTHLHEDMLSHCQLTSDLIETLKNEQNVLKCDLEKSLSQSRIKDNQIAMLESEMKVRIQNEIMLKEQLDIQSSQIEDVLIEKENMKANLSKIQREFVSLTERLMNKEREMNEQKQEMEYSRTYIDGQIVTTLESDVTELDEINTSVEEKEELEFINEENCPQVDVNFIWKIEECSSKVDTQMWSDPFYYNEYKFCLSLCVNSYNDNIQLYCYIKRGNKDDQLEWPLSCSVTMSMVEHDFVNAYHTETFSDEFPRPRYDKGVGIGSLNFIKYSVVKEHCSVQSNNSIIVTCAITNN